tara:strand:- start:164 stop:661 length:498 start_codon:yes stop_codon:yes gene_type:complete
MAKCLLICFISLSSAALKAHPEDKEQILYLSSDEADLNQGTKKGLFKGHVKIDQGTSHLRALEAETLGDSENKLIKAIARGGHQTKAHFWTTLTQNQTSLHAWAEIIYYLPKENRIELIGNAEISQGKNSFKAPKIIYDTKKQHIITESHENKRTTMTFYPEKKI